MIKLADCSAITQMVVKVSMFITAIGICAGAAAWAADTRYHTLVAQAAYVQTVNDEKRASEIRQLQREIYRLELKDENGTASGEDKAMSKYLQRDLEELQAQ